MRLARKLNLALVATLLVVFAARTLVRVRYEFSRAHEELRSGQVLMGHALRPAFVQVWRTMGPVGVTGLLHSTDASISRERIRWVSLDGGAPPERTPEAPRAALTGLARGLEVSVVHEREGEQRLASYVPLSADGSIPGALEISEPTSAVHQAVRERLFEALSTTVVTAALSMLVVSMLGLVLVGRPIRELVETARRMGKGDLSRGPAIRQSDEIGELAEEMDDMRKRLGEAQDHLASEASARIAALEQLQHAERLSTVGKMASGIAHELGTPLNVVTGRAKMIATGEIAGDEIRPAARNIVEQGQRMAKIIRQLLDFSRRSSPAKAPCDLVDLARSAVALVQPLAEAKHLRLTLSIDRPPPRVLADAGQIQQALTNIVVNAVQAVGEAGKVEVAVGESFVDPPADLGAVPASYAYIAVQDDGVGIPPDRLPRVFEPFFTTKPVGEGTGLGLSVAYGIVRHHGGWISASSEPGRGSRFTIFLPGPEIT